ncbi:MAG: Asp-tRNA(Asn)/Glu-tRNA(Gln) amidotransferase subunit GatB [Candidatus Aenigmatarchaeota archaeon]
MVRIGLEVHVQLLTETKLFCGCPNRFVREPNTYVCETCLGFPGSKPRLNARALDAAIKIGLSLNCKMPQRTWFDRKTYFYPDMSKNFQITQYAAPFAEKGWLEIDGKKIRIARIQLEEDPARLIHVGGGIAEAKHVFIDYNRSGTPLCEIVTEPDLESPEQARKFLQVLSSMMEYMGIYDSSIEGSMRVDANISVDKSRIEVKNISGFKDVEQALNYEIIRQRALVKQGRTIARETRAWDEASGVTRSLRAKEEAEEYGYITDTDLPIITLSEQKLAAAKAGLPEFASAKVQRYVKELKIQRELAAAIVSEPDIAEAFEQVIKAVPSDRAAPFFAKTLKKVLNFNNLRLRSTKLTTSHLVKLIQLVERGALTDRAAELMLRDLATNPKPPDPEEFMKRRDMARISDEATLAPFVEKVLSENVQALAEFRAGRSEAFEFFVGQVMRATQGRADPKALRELLKKKLARE